MAAYRICPLACGTLTPRTPMTRSLTLPALLGLVLLSGCMMSRPAPAAYSSSSSSSSSRGASLVVINNASQPIYYLYASRCSSSSWGEDQLDSDQVIMPGSEVSFTMGTGCWDLKAVMRDGREVVERNAQITASDWRWTIG